MALDINALRAAFGTTNKPQAPSNYFPFFAMQDGDQSTIRFLPDADSSNPLGFLVEKRTHVLKVNGRDKTVPCLKMYGKTCPVCNVSSQYYNNGDRNLGKKYYRKIQHIGQALVTATSVVPKEGDDKFEGTVRLVQISPQIHKVIQEAIMSGDLEDNPCDFLDGTNFVIKKDKQGDYSSYSFSKFARRSTPLDEDTIEYCKTQMKDLSTLIPAEPPLEEIEAWLEADMTGGEGPVTASAPRVDASNSDEQEAIAALAARRQANAAAAKPAIEEDDEEDGEMDDVLAAIAARRRQRNEE